MTLCDPLTAFVTDAFKCKKLISEPELQNRRTPPPPIRTPITLFCVYCVSFVPCVLWVPLCHVGHVCVRCVMGDVFPMCVTCAVCAMCTVRHVCHVCRPTYSRGPLRRRIRRGIRPGR